jgi:hypothetical protein
MPLPQASLYTLFKEKTSNCINSSNLQRRQQKWETIINVLHMYITYLLTWLDAVRATILQTDHKTSLYCRVVRVCSKDMLSINPLHLSLLALEQKTVRLKQNCVLDNEVGLLGCNDMQTYGKWAWLALGRRRHELCTLFWWVAQGTQPNQLQYFSRSGMTLIIWCIVLSNVCF